MIVQLPAVTSPEWEEFVRQLWPNKGGGLGAVDPTLLKFKRYREAGKRLRWYFEQQAWRADGMVMLHKYVEGKHQDDCPWCEFRDAS